MSGDLGDRRAVGAHRDDPAPDVAGRPPWWTREFEHLDRGLQRQLDARVGAPGGQCVRPYQAWLIRGIRSVHWRLTNAEESVATTGRRYPRAPPASPSRNRSVR